MIKMHMTNRDSDIQKRLEKTSGVILGLESIIPDINKAINIISKCLISGNKVILFGNGGSAADAQHIAAELVGKFNFNRSSLPALALTTNSSTLTSISNDYSFDRVFSRQCESLVKKGDVVIGISTSGNSPNVINGAKIAKKKNVTSIGLLGNNGGNLKDHLTIPIIVTSNSTPRIQEVHRIILHAICQIVEDNFSKTN